MKLYTNLFSAFILVLFSCSLIYAQDSIKVVPKISNETIELNYLEGVESGNLGLRISASYYLGERKSSKAVIPLMKILHTDKSPEARIMAALSLFKIDDARGIYAIKEAITHDSNDWVRKMCKVFYQMYLTNKESETKKD